MAYYFSPFRKKYAKPSSAACPFCDARKMSSQSVKNKRGTSIENEHYRWVINYFPKFEGHTMVVPKRHITNLDEETPEEMIARGELTKLAAKTLQKLYRSAGVEVFIQYGPQSEASVPHLHWHVVPAQKNDPLRGFDKLGQFFSTDESQAKILVFPVTIKLAQKSLQNALRKLL